MDSKGKITWQTILITALIGFVIVLVVRPDVIPGMGEKGSAGIEFEVIYADGSTLKIARTASLLYRGLAIYDEAGKEITSVRGRLWVYPTLTDITASSVSINYQRDFSVSPTFSGFVSVKDSTSVTVNPNVKTVLDGSALSFNHSQFLMGAVADTWYTVTFKYSGTGSAGGYSDDFSTTTTMKVKYVKSTATTGSIVIDAGVQTDKLQITR